MTSDNSYEVPANTITCTQEIKKSKFITTVGRASNANNARNFIKKVSSEYPDASHNCYAFIAGAPGGSGEVGLSDDGEVPGTAGKPMLNVLQHKKIGEIAAVVTRFFGGVKLGPGGLVRAYTSSLQMALDKLELKRHVDVKSAEMIFDFQFENTVRRVLKQLGIETGDVKYGDSVIFNVELPVNLFDKLLEDIGNQTRGKVKINLK